MFYMTRRREILGWKLTIYVRGFSVECMLGGTKHPHQANALIQKRTAAIGRGQGLPLASIS